MRQRSITAVDEEHRMNTMLRGKIVAHCIVDDRNEGSYKIIFNDGTTVEFSSSGDDMTTTNMVLRNYKGEKVR